MKLPNEFELKEYSLEELNKITSKENFVGVIKNLPEELYHTCKGLSRSAIVEAKDNLSNYIEYFQKERKVTEAMKFGTDAHCAILEPKKFQANYVAEPSKEEFSDLLISSDDIRNKLSTLIETQHLKDGIEELELALTSSENESKNNLSVLDTELEILMSKILPENFKTKKAYNEELKSTKAPFLEQTKKVNDEQKEFTKNTKETIKELKKNLSDIESVLKSTKATMSQELLKLDPTANIWEVIINDFREKSVNKIIVTQDNLKKLKKIMDNAKKRTLLQAMMASGFPELTIFWTDKETGLLLKVRIDFLTITKDMAIPLDIKTCMKAEEYTFAKDAGNRLYHVQAAMYMDGLNMALSPILKEPIESFVFVACEKEKACEVNEVKLGSASIDKGYEIYRNCLNKVAHYLDSKKREQIIDTGYQQGLKEIELPIYHLA